MTLNFNNVCTEYLCAGVAVLSNIMFRQELENLAPSAEKFVELSTSGRVRGVIVTLRGSAENGCVDETGRVYDFVSRYFMPWNGVNEDPVCGTPCRYGG